MDSVGRRDPSTIGEILTADDARASRDDNPGCRAMPTRDEFGELSTTELRDTREYEERPASTGSSSTKRSASPDPRREFTCDVVCAAVETAWLVLDGVFLDTGAFEIADSSPDAGAFGRDGSLGGAASLESVAAFECAATFGGISPVGACSLALGWLCDAICRGEDLVRDGVDNDDDDEDDDDDDDDEDRVNDDVIDDDDCRAACMADETGVCRACDACISVEDRVDADVDVGMPERVDWNDAAVDTDGGATCDAGG